MSTRLRALFALCFLCLLFIGFARPALAAAASDNRHLSFVLILTRHGVRAPSSLPKKLDLYSVHSWPQWPVPPDYLTDHGYKLLLQLGAWDRNWLINEGLLSSSGCNASAIYIYTDSDERTIRSGHALAQSLSPNCTVTVHSLPEGAHDPLFHFPVSNLDAGTRAQIIAAVRNRFPLGLEAFTASHKGQLDLLQSVLDGCKPDTLCPQITKRPAVRMEDIPNRIEIKPAHDIVSVQGPVFSGASLAEDMLLEYAQGLPRDQVAWGLLKESQLREIIGLHTAEFSIEHRTPALARVQISNLLEHLLLTLQQSVQGRARKGAFGTPGKKLVIVDGHDTDIAAIAGLLHLHWTLDGRRDDTPPGTQLKFLVFRDRRGRAGIQVRIVMQTLDQMRHARPLVESNPPAAAILDLPSCKMEEQTCSWTSFETTVSRTINQRFVMPLKQ